MCFIAVLVYKALEMLDVGWCNVALNNGVV